MDSPSPPAPARPEPLDEHDALAAGTRLGELEVVKVLGVGGFGIVYLARDHALEREVALKEYMPSALATRGQGRMVSVRSGSHTETYAIGLRSFVNEARLLARFNHPSLVKVYRFWEENGTAYMVMPYLQGRTLREVRRSMSAAPTEAWIRSVIEPLLDALEHLHREDVFHRDIAPDNILLPPGELPVLLDFGAARRAIGDRTQLFTAILKPSYAPIEQYADVVQLRQGAWTDLYALGAVVYYLLRGAPPPPATARAVQDDVPLLDARQHPDVSPAFIAAVEWALAIKPGDRPQSVAALREVLEGRASAPPRAATATPAGEFPPTLIIGRPVTGADPIEPTRPMTRPQPAPAPAPAIAAPAVERTRVVPPARPAAPPEPAARPRRRRSASRIAWLLVSIAGFSALAAGAGWMIGERSGERSNAVTTTAAPAAAPTAMPAVARIEPSPAPASAPTVAAALSDKPAPLPARKPAPRPRAVDAAPAALQDNPPPAVATAAPSTSVPAQAQVSRPVSAAVVEGAMTPRQACGSRVFMALALCMEEQCETARFRGHAQCRKVLERLERRRRGEALD